ncbi:MAG: hypothetical protein M3R02_16435 [Chloroflexota bacterium]|nr:hypothetical protein [Chloroflexota bacterium]
MATLLLLVSGTGGDGAGTGKRKPGQADDDPSRVRPLHPAHTATKG